MSDLTVRPDPALEHDRECWKLDGHHACAIALVEKLRRHSYHNVIRAFGKRGEMIAHLTTKNVALTRQVDSLSKVARRRA